MTEMKEFMEAYALVIELFLYAYNDQIDRGYSTDDSIKIAKTIVEMILNINKKENHNND